jgi:signal transduction histidine kinase
MIGIWWATWQGWRRSPVRDVLFALVMTVITVFGSYGEAHPSQISDKLPAGSAAAHTPPAAFLLVALASLVLAGASRWPIQVLAVSNAAVAVYSLLGYENGAALLAPTAALYAVATSQTVRRTIVWSAVTLVVLMGASAANNPFGPAGGGFYLIPALVAAAGLGGIAVSNRRAYVLSRAEQDARRRIDEERLRIARELHDVVAHTMATINVQAGVAAHVVKEHPDAAEEALQTIKTASKEGLRELRAILNVLRQADEAEPTQPAPGVAQLATLTDGACRAGLATKLVVTGSERPLPAAVDLAAYRIVQESLTNSIRHAGPATAIVTLNYHDSGLGLDVTDTGRGQAPADGLPGTGHGLAGMRERAASVGGTIEAGPSLAGGYRVTAWLPTGREHQTGPPTDEAAGAWAPEGTPS